MQYEGTAQSCLTLTFFSKMVIPWYLYGLLNSMNSALSGLMVKGATIISALSETSSPIKPDHSFFPKNQSSGQAAFFYDSSYLKNSVFRSFRTAHQVKELECTWSWSSSTVDSTDPCRNLYSNNGQFLELQYDKKYINKQLRLSVTVLGWVEVRANYFVRQATLLVFRNFAGVDKRLLFDGEDFEVSRDHEPFGFWVQPARPSYFLLVDC